jgi:hydroxymethylpyrimidine pyrophosphatase-like HAD family hydrolase
MWLAVVKPALSERVAARYSLLPAEADFYSAYDWCLDPHLTAADAVDRLAVEIDRLSGTPEGWQTGEVVTNVYLLSCSLLNGIDEYLRGRTLRLPAQLARTWPARGAAWAAEEAEALPRRSRAQVSRWKERWQNGLDAFFAVLARGGSDPASFMDAAQQLSEVLRSPLPGNLLGARLGIPSAFSRLDLTHSDVLALGRRFMDQCPDKSLPVLVLGLRTAGTYFSALLRSALKAGEYRRVASLTVQPVKGPGRREYNELRSYAKQSFTVLIVDDPPHTGGAIARAVQIVRQAGFDLGRIKVLVPAHPAARDWAAVLPEGLVITLGVEEWRKQELLVAKQVELRLTEYFAQQGVSGVRVISSLKADELNARLRAGGKRGAPLRRIFEVELRGQGKDEIRYVLAKSVGLGFLGYPAFLAAHRLSDFVPPLLGLRDGILYTEWLPQQSEIASVRDRDASIDRAAAYVAARTRLLGLPKHRVPGKAVHENGLELLAKSFARACGRFVLNIPMRSWIEQRLYQLRCPCPTLIDGNMDCAEWIEGSSGPLKTGYYGHALGKTQLNVIDPAYDLAETILSFALTPEEEDRLIRRYALHSGDVGIRERLLINKLLAGLWTMEVAQEQLFDTIQSPRQQQEQHRRFLGAWDFLALQSARFCGARCRPSQPASWQAPLVVLDVDGVIDRRIFGYPCTTAAGIEALSLLARHGYSVTLNTARSVREVKAYCEAYGLAGGVAEGGAYLWDAVGGRGRSLIDDETMIQLDQLRKELLRIPGVFLDDRHRYSIRAYMIETKPVSSLTRLLNSIRSFNVGEGVPVPLPTLIVSQLLTSLRLDRLSFHPTTIDTAIVAKGVDKGIGSTALRDWVLEPGAETIAVGDTKADLPMFRVATRSYAPAHIHCRREAQLLNCAISRYRYQRGLLDIVRNIVKCESHGDLREPANQSEGESLFLSLLRAADHFDARALTRALFDRASFRIFMR